MGRRELHVVTGAFGYSGRYIAQRLLEAGHEVRTLTNSPGRKNPFGGRVPANRFCFEDPPRMVEFLKGAEVLYNTYWVRFNYQDFRYAEAVANTLALFRAAREAGVRRVIHLSISNPSEESSLEYFRGKAQLERALRESEFSWAILRPTVLFGKEDILINNIAWMLRKFPFFGVFGDGRYQLQPIHVDDLAKLAVEQGARQENCLIDAIGPETFTFRELVGTIAKAIGQPRPIVSIPPWAGHLAGAVLGTLLGDVVITRDEIEGLMEGLLYTHSQPAGETRLTDWVQKHAETLGKRYASELARRRNRKEAYEEL